MSPYDYYIRATNNASQSAAPIRSDLQAGASQASTRTDLLTPKVTDAQNALIGILSRRGTQQDRAGAINRRKGNLTSNYVNARSRIQAGLGGRVANSMEAGQLANLEAGHANALNSLYNETDDAMRGEEAANAEAILRILSGARDASRGEYLQNTGLMRDIDQSSISNFGNLSQMDEAIKARKAQEAQQWLNSVAGIAGLAGQWFMPGRKGAV